MLEVGTHTHMPHTPMVIIMVMIMIIVMVNRSIFNGKVVE